MTDRSRDFAQSEEEEVKRFDPYRIVVRSWWGYGRAFEPRDVAQIRAWHKVDRLTDSKKGLSGEVKAAGGSCSITYQLKVRYQPTVGFAISRFRMKQELPASLFGDYTNHVEAAIEGTLLNLKASEVLNQDALSNAGKEIAEKIRVRFEKDGITCEARCDLQIPHVDWPKQDPKTPEPIPNQDLFFEVQRQHTQFFLSKDQMEKDGKAAQEEQDAKNSVAADVREKRRRLIERDALAAKQVDEILKRDLEDKHAELVRGRDTKQHEEELKAACAEQKRKMDAERDLREHKIDLSKVDMKFLESEEALHKAAIKSARAEAEAKEVEAVVSRESEIRFKKEEAEIEHRFEIEKRSELLKILPEIVEKSVGAQQRIEHLRVVQVNGAGETGHGLSNSPSFQMAQAVALIREFLTALDERQP